jgi:uncharacterized membrane protein
MDEKWSINWAGLAFVVITFVVLGVGFWLASPILIPIGIFCLLGLILQASGMRGRLGR